MDNYCPIQDSEEYVPLTRLQWCCIAGIVVWNAVAYTWFN